MKLAVVQMNPVFGEVGKNIERAFQLMEKTHADLYVLPELFTTGYNFLNLDELNSLAEPINGRTFQKMADFAYDHQCYIVYGFAEKNGYIYNSAALVGSEGLLGVYRKVHLFDREKLLFKMGNLGFPVFPTTFGKVGIMICFDWMFPESARTLALKGAHVIAHPSNLVLPYCPDAMVTRCIENRVYSATANRVGEENRGDYKYKFIGTSEIVSPNGTILTRLSQDEENISVKEIDILQAENKAINSFNHIIGDRHPESYSLT